MRSEYEEANLIWDGIEVERDIPELYECRKKKDAVACLGEYFDGLNFNEVLNTVPQEKRESYLSDVKSYFIDLGIIDWMGELEELGLITWKYGVREGIEL